jgi:group II intron maturase
MYNLCARGWIGYCGHSFKAQLRPTLKRIDAYVIRWVCRKFKRMRYRTKGARDWFDRFHRANRPLFGHMPGQRLNIGNRVTREAHARVLGALGRCPGHPTAPDASTMSAVPP